MDDHEMVQQLLMIALTVAVVVILCMILCLYEALIGKPGRLRASLVRQGISGPPPSFFLGNLPEIKRTSFVKLRLGEDQTVDGVVDGRIISHNCSSKVFPFLKRWRERYGPVFMFSLGNKQILHVYDMDMVKEMTMFTSLDLGKPSYQFRDLGPLLGRGILTSNGDQWAHQRRIIAPELYASKVKGMVDLIVESSTTLVKSWEDMIDKSEGGVVDIGIDASMRSFSGDVISRACFGSNFAKGEEIFIKLRGLQEALSQRMLTGNLIGLGVALKHLPTKSNRAIWRLEKEVRSLILEVAKEREAVAKPGNDLLQLILKGAKDDMISEEMDNFIVDNCKNIYLAGYETTAIAATWLLMLLASNPDWQAKVREEINEVCAGQLPDWDMIRKMKRTTMVIHESFRLYPPVAIFSREARQDIKFENVLVPEGVTVWAPVATLHTDPNIWGPDAALFRPERFSNGVSGSCRLPHVYMPFGVGPRLCLGQNLAMAELKVLTTVILSKFTLLLSPTYKHSPTMRLVVEPENGVNLIVKKLQ